MIESASRRGAVLALAILSLVWGLNWIVMKAVLAYVGPLTFSAMRYVFGVIVLFAVLAVRRENLAPTPWRATLVIGVAQTTGFQALVQLALLHGGAGKTALLAYTMPFWVVPVAWLVLGDRPAPRQWACLGIAALGLLLVLEPWRSHAGLVDSLLALGGGLSWAIGTVVAKRTFRDASISPLRLTAWQMACGTLLLVGIALCVPERSIDWSAPLFAALLYNGVLSAGLAWALWLFVVQRLPTHVAGLTSLIVPLIGVLLAWLLLGEAPDGAEALGIAVIGMALLGVLAPQRAR